MKQKARGKRGLLLTKSPMVVAGGCNNLPHAHAHPPPAAAFAAVLRYSAANGSGFIHPPRVTMRPANWT